MTYIHILENTRRCCTGRECWRLNPFLYCMSPAITLSYTGGPTGHRGLRDHFVLKSISIPNGIWPVCRRREVDSQNVKSSARSTAFNGRLVEGRVRNIDVPNGGIPMSWTLPLGLGVGLPLLSRLGWMCRMFQLDTIFPRGLNRRQDFTLFY